MVILKINNIGYNNHHGAEFCIYRPSGSGDNLLLLIKTPAIFNLNGEDVTAQKNSFILYREGTAQFYRSNGGEYANDWFHFSFSDDELSVFTELGIPFDTVIPLGDIGNLSTLIKNMSIEFFADAPHRDESVELYMRLFFIKLSDKLHSPQNTASSHYDKMSAVRSRIYSIPQYNWSIDALARELSMSKSHFEHMYKQLFGISVMNEVINSRLEYAKFILSSSDTPINQIAEMCGYNNDIHFMRQFKSRLGLTPSQYRTQHRLIKN